MLGFVIVDFDVVDAVVKTADAAVVVDGVKVVMADADVIVVSLVAAAAAIVVAIDVDAVVVVADATTVIQLQPPKGLEPFEILSRMLIVCHFSISGNKKAISAIFRFTSD